MQKLNKEQQMAVRHRDGPMLVLAGPGSGKTAVLVNRVLHLVREEHIDPYNILVLTFSKPAAEEMRSRFMSLADASYPVTFGTFHAIFYHILKSQGLYRTGEILTQDKKRTLLGITARRMGLKRADDTEKLKRLAENIGIKKLGCTRLLDELSEDEAVELELVYEPYLRLCRSEGLIDFDDMINECLKALKGNDKILSKWQQRYRYILVDEFQDIDNRQYEILKLLGGKLRNIFCVGDDDQSIYSFRGAEPAVMRRFVEDFPDARIVELKLNYRCPEEIIDRAGRLIRCNKDRFEKKQVCAGSLINVTGLRDAGSAWDDRGAAPGARVEYRCFRSQADEAGYCAELVDSIIEKFRIEASGSEAVEHKGVPAVGILYRTSQSADILEELLRQRGIPYRRKDRAESFYAKEWVKDVTAYLKLAVGLPGRSGGEIPNEYKDELFRILNRPERGLTRESISGNCITRDTISGYYLFDERLHKICRKMFDDIDFAAGMNCYSSVNYILKGIGLEGYIKKRYFAGQKGREAEEAIRELMERAKGYKTAAEWPGLLEDSGNDSSERPYVAGPGIELMTIHGSKGLEFDNVIMIGLQEGIFPGKRCETAGQLEEERRLFYVAMTRCRKRLWMTGIRKDEYGKTESRFIREAGFNSETDGSIL